MSIDKIRLSNFRGFSAAEIALPGLTVLLGANSSGKSSFGQAIAALAHAHASFPEGDRLTLTPFGKPQVTDQWPVDFGMLADLRTRGATGPVVVALHTRDGWVEYGFGLDGVFSDLRLAVIRHPGEAAVTAQSVTEGVVEHAATVPASPDDAITGVGASIPLPAITQDNIVELRRVDAAVWIDPRHANQRAVPMLSGLALQSYRHVTGTDMAVSTVARQDVCELIENAIYLRPVRERASRSYPLQTPSMGHPVGYSGETMPATLLANASREIPWREPPFTTATASNMPAVLNAEWPARRGPLGAALAYWLNRLQLARSAEAQERESDRMLQVRVGMNDHDQTFDITEVGFGVSQVLPVLVAGLLVPDDGLLIVDLPEAHLHPYPQAVLADFFAGLVLSGRRVLIETHSETLFQRLRLLSAAFDSVHAKVAAYFLDAPKGGRCCEPRLIGLSLAEELCWPEGFFLESLELEAAIRKVRQMKGMQKG